MLVRHRTRTFTIVAFQVHSVPSYSILSIATSLSKAGKMPGRRLRLLCLDGGGVRGLASLFLLKQILTFVGNPKPCDFFDMIAGTSTGG
jgi:hypothetical protein